MSIEVGQGTQAQSGHTERGVSKERIACSVGIMAYNEEENIAHTLHAVLHQCGPSFCINEIIVVASGCTDSTVPIVTEMGRQEPRIRLLVQEKREGKASAINLFLKHASSEVAILIGADVIPEAAAFEKLCAPFQNPQIGMVGGRPIPVNDRSTFMGHAVHLVWRLHDRLARIVPKLGEVIAFRHVIVGIPATSAVDEISIQALISQLGYQLVYEPGSVVYNKGPLTVGDFLKQRRRIYAGHLKVLAQQNYEASTMKVAPIARQLWACRRFTMSTPQKALWTLGAVALEGLARLQGYYDFWRKREHYIWQRVDSTKNLQAGMHKIRRISHSQSVIIFRLIIEESASDGSVGERGEREASEVARGLLPSLRARLRKQDKLTVNGAGIMTAVIRADQHDAEMVAQRIKEVIEVTPVRVGVRGREVRAVVAYSCLTFATWAPSRDATVASGLSEQAVAMAIAE